MDGRIYHAVIDDNTLRLRSLLRIGGNPNVWLEDTSAISGKYLLHVCCEKGRYKCAQILLEYGAQADIQGSWGQTPLMLCIRMEYFEIAELLMNNNKKIVDQQDSSGNTPLHYAIGNDSVEGVKLLLKYGADVNIMNIIGLTPMLQICSTKESQHMDEIVELLVLAGAQVDEKDFKSRRTALQRAALSLNIPTVEYLLNIGADPNTTDNSGRNPVSNLIWEHIRTRPNKSELDYNVMTVMHLLITAGTKLNNSIYENSSPLILAINIKSVSLVNYLLVQGASLHGNFFGGITPLLHAINKKDLAIVKVLLNWSCDLHRKAHMFKYNYDTMYDSFELAVHVGCPEIALLLVEVGYDVSKVRCLFDMTSDIPECLQNRPDILERLLEYVHQPKSLFDSTVICIRRALCDNIAHKAETLPLPKLLIEDIKLTNILS